MKYKKLTKEAWQLLIKIGDKIICPDGSTNTVIGFDTDINMFFVWIQGAKCFIDGDDYKVIQ